MATVLLVEDNPNTLQLVRLYLEREGHRVLTAQDGLTALALFHRETPDLLVLDLMLPGMDGMEVCRRVREESEVPIIMLTARVEEEDRLAGLDLGADDYITKPFSPRELCARVRAVLRRVRREPLPSEPVLRRGDLVVDLRKRAVFLEGRRLHLTPTEFRILALLAREPGRVFTRDEILDRAFGHDFEGFDRTVDAHISNLRRKLGDDPRAPRYIQTVYGVGYRFGEGDEGVGR